MSQLNPIAVNKYNSVEITIKLNKLDQDQLEFLKGVMQNNLFYPPEEETISVRDLREIIFNTVKNYQDEVEKFKDEVPLVGINQESFKDEITNPPALKYPYY